VPDDPAEQHPSSAAVQIAAEATILAELGETLGRQLKQGVVIFLDDTEVHPDGVDDDRSGRSCQSSPWKFETSARYGVRPSLVLNCAQPIPTNAWRRKSSLIREILGPAK
jgi:hypothetical protein